jgi:hypothetical protein
MPAREHKPSTDAAAKAPTVATTDNLQLTKEATDRLIAAVDRLIAAVDRLAAPITVDVKL